MPRVLQTRELVAPKENFDFNARCAANLRAEGAKGKLSPMARAPHTRAPQTPPPQVPKKILTWVP